MLLVLMACSKDSERTSLFSGAGESAARAQVTSKNPVSLPADHASHPAYELEWWYLTFVLKDAQERPYGVQFTLFRFGTDSGFVSNWSNAQQWMGHASLHSLNDHAFESRFAAGGVGNAGVGSAPFSAWIDDWQWQSDSDAPFPATLRFRINQHTQLSLTVKDNGPYIRHGDNGVSVKSRDGKFRSYYYSQPFLTATGAITHQGTQRAVSGEAWYDHEWTSQLARREALGWDWFSVHFDNGDKLMAFQMHVDDAVPYTTGTYIKHDGTARTLTDSDLTIRPTGYETINEKPVPVNWQITSQAHDINISVSPFKSGQWNPGQFAYYEGRVTVSGTHKGSGFMELTGYQ
ncbi:carotenoid 1,2-hydratase [Salinimonas sp. HHU 13199]|uniref:Carotenoid 1,2-hydratase n=2 Tax=Salinimonas profundi TaxID=2729140 RepID=A0ABR8LMK9_9ALTE|nr:carotenoid 1,2-hydratase [Salinimonas profundi]